MINKGLWDVCQSAPVIDGVPDSVHIQTLINFARVISETPATRKLCDLRSEQVAMLIASVGSFRSAFLPPEDRAEFLEIINRARVNIAARSGQELEGGTLYQCLAGNI